MHEKSIDFLDFELHPNCPQDLKMQELFLQEILNMIRLFVVKTEDFLVSVKTLASMNEIHGDRSPSR